LLGEGGREFDSQNREERRETRERGGRGYVRNREREREREGEMKKG